MRRFLWSRSGKDLHPARYSRPPMSGTRQGRGSPKIPAVLARTEPLDPKPASGDGDYSLIAASRCGCLLNHLEVAVTHLVDELPSDRSHLCKGGRARSEDKRQRHKAGK